MLKLSPFNFSRLIANMRGANAQIEEKPLPRRRAIECWKCPHCDDVYDDEDDAEECCLTPQSANEDDDGDCTPDANCPVCTNYAGSIHEAASCCLWKDFDMATRHRIADAVELGSTWIEAIEAESKKH